jgi:hypothetical protein
MFIGDALLPPFIFRRPERKHQEDQGKDKSKMDASLLYAGKWSNRRSVEMKQSHCNGNGKDYYAPWV